MDAPLHGNNPAAPRGSAEDGAAHLPKNGGSGEQEEHRGSAVDMAKSIAAASAAHSSPGKNTAKKDYRCGH